MLKMLFLDTSARSHINNTLNHVQKIPSHWSICTFQDHHHYNRVRSAWYDSPIEASAYCIWVELIRVSKASLQMIKVHVINSTKMSMSFYSYSLLKKPLYSYLLLQTMNVPETFAVLLLHILGENSIYLREDITENCQKIKSILDTTDMN